MTDILQDFPIAAPIADVFAAIAELELTEAMPDWVHSRVGFVLEDRGHDTWVHFSHRGWSDANEHYRISSHCWALYLRILRRYLEHGERVPYAVRLSA
jgi:hypothetical protein